MSAFPAPLKTADIERFAQRAAQLEKVKPVIAYWCNYYVVDAILQQKLHSQSEECMTYTINLMERLEKVKKDEETNDAIHDEVAAQAYVEQFALEVYSRADNAVRNKKANKQTVDTFSAARTFLEVLGIWQKPISDDIKARIKYAKYHEVRILKALRAGEDPNVGEGVPSPAPGTPAPPLDPNDPEVQKLNAASMQPTVEDTADREAGGVVGTAPPHAFASQPSVPSFQTSHVAGDVSPLEESEQPPEQHGYFPPAPPGPPSFSDGGNAGVASTFSPVQSPPVDAPQNFYNAPAVPSIPPAPSPSFSQAPSIPQNFTPQPPYNPSPGINTFVHSAPPPSAFTPSQVLPQHHQPTPRAPEIPSYQPEPVNSTGFRTDDASLAEAQKHAKWAISALNFDDVNTAVKELRTALRALGA